MMNHVVDHALTTVRCTLDGMEAVIQMTMEVDDVNMDAVGYLLQNCIATIREQCDAVEKQVQDAPGEPPRGRQGAFCPTAGPNITKQEKMH